MKIPSVIIVYLLFYLGVSASDIGLTFLYVCVCVLYENADPLDVYIL